MQLDLGQLQLSSTMHAVCTVVQLCVMRVLLLSMLQ
jgi:hypothetical protein